MKNINITVIEGNLTRDSDLRYTPNGTAVLSLSIASNSDYKKGEEWIKDVMFLNITVWGKYAESLNDRLAKGVTIICEGRLKQENWNDKDTGSPRSKLSLTANNIQIRNRAASKDSIYQNNGNQQNDYPPKEDPIPGIEPDKFTGPDDSDIPF